MVIENTTIPLFAGKSFYPSDFPSSGLFVEAVVGCRLLQGSRCTEACQIALQRHCTNYPTHATKNCFGFEHNSHVPSTQLLQRLCIDRQLLWPPQQCPKEEKTLIGSSNYILRKSGSVGYVTCSRPGRSGAGSDLGVLTLEITRPLSWPTLPLVNGALTFPSPRDGP